jgi:hypothetical protein
MSRSTRSAGWPGSSAGHAPRPEIGLPRVWQEAQRDSHGRHWPEIDRLLTTLPPHLLGQARLLQYDLALRCSRSGRFTDIFLGPDELPVLSIGSWLLDDLGATHGRARRAAEQRLFVAAVLLAMRTEAIEAIPDEGSFSDETQLALVQLCSERAVRELSRLMPAGSPFWAEHERVSLDGLERRLEARDLQLGRPSADHEALLTCRWSAPLRILAAAAVTLAGRAELATPVGRMLDDLAVAHQVRADLETMHADLLAGRMTYPIAAVARAAGIALQPMPAPEAILGALVVTGAAVPILDAAIARLHRCREVVADLGLTTAAAYVDAVEARFGDHRRRLLGEPGPSDGAGHGQVASEPLLRRADPTLPRALVMAERSLLSDPSFRESWECHREGMLGSDEVVSRFPAGLILEMLCGHGLDLAAQVDEFLAFTAANAFRYYDHPWSGADSDTLGVFLRLLTHAKNPGQHAQPLEAVLERLEGEVRVQGSIPVWIAERGSRTRDRPEVVALGEGCGTVAAHLLLGLLGLGPGVHRATLDTGASHLVERLRDVGLGANVNYPGHYALAVFYRLLARLEVAALPGVGTGAVSQARLVLDAELRRATSGRILSAQQAALMVIACRDADRQDLLRRSWLVRMLKQQRFDGSWTGEPFAPAPNRGGRVSWYSSTTLTTALCHAALLACARAGPFLGDREITPPHLTAGV